MTLPGSCRRSRLAGARWRLMDNIGPIVGEETPAQIADRIMSVVGDRCHNPHRAFNRQVDRQVYELERIIDRMLAE